MEPSEPLSKTRKSQIPNSTDDRSPHIYPYRNDIISINYLISRIDDALEAQVAFFLSLASQIFFFLKRRSDLTLQNHAFNYKYFVIRNANKYTYNNTNINYTKSNIVHARIFFNICNISTDFYIHVIFVEN